MSGTTSSASPTVISDMSSLAALLSDLTSVLIKSTQSTSEADKVKLYIDLEGNNLSREGTLSLLTVLIHPLKKTFLIDVHTLRDQAFSTRSLVPLILSQPPYTSPGTETNDPKGKGKEPEENDTTTTPSAPSLNSNDTETNNVKFLTLKSLLEDRAIPKYLWDVRNDADALFSHHSVRLTGVIDVQLFEVASRPRTRDKKYLCGLDTCIEKDLGLKSTERSRFLSTKHEVRLMMDKADPSNSRRDRGNGGGSGGSSRSSSTDIFARRPLPAKLVDYCTGDVVYLPALYEVYSRRIKSDWREKALEESAKRVEEAFSSGFKPHGYEKKFGPSSWTSYAMNRGRH